MRDELHHIGISGWHYPEWRGSIYPRGLPQKDQLAYISKLVGTIELNSSFYGLQTPDRYERWYQQTPGGFIFSVKGSRYITNFGIREDTAQPLANFFASGVLALEDKLGPFLWQFPPHLEWDEGQFRGLLSRLPRDTHAARNLARGHDEHVKDPYFPTSDVPKPLRHAIEVRHKSFACSQFFDLLREYNVAVVIADTSGKWPMLEVPTADFLYLRLHGSQKLYRSNYSDQELSEWQSKIQLWSQFEKRRRETYVYFDNTMEGHALRNAIAFKQMLTGSTDKLAG